MSGKRFERSLNKQVEELGEGLRADLRQPSRGLIFAERFLSAIIASNPIDDGKGDLQRLSAAMNALFGKDVGPRRSDTNSDALALRYMAEIYHASGEKISIEKLAEKGAAAAPGGLRDSTIRRLSKKWSNEKTSLMAGLEEGAVAIDVLHIAALDDLAEMLPQLGIAFDFDESAL